MTKIELIQPVGWNDITFNQWKNLLSLDLIEDLDELTKRLKQVHILNPHIKDETDIGKLTIPQLTQYFSTIEFIKDEPVKEIFNEFELDGKKYKQIQFKDISLAQWIDAEKFSIDVIQHHQLIAIFYINPQEYNDIERDRVAEYIDNLPCSKVFYLVSQFFFIQTALEKTLEEYSVQMRKKKDKIERIIKTSKKISTKIQKLFGSKSYTI